MVGVERNSSPLSPVIAESTPTPKDHWDRIAVPFATQARIRGPKRETADTNLRQIYMDSQLRFLLRCCF